VVLAVQGGGRRCGVWGVGGRHMARSARHSAQCRARVCTKACA